MRQRFEGAFTPGASVSFDAPHTMDGGYAQATATDRTLAAQSIISRVPDRGEARTLLDMLGLLPALPAGAN